MKKYIDDETIKDFRKKIFTFYKDQGRDLPWRKTEDPYKILLSEFMLQQTQVSRVIDYYTRWITQWDTIKKLADAPFFDILSQWMGLGYNRRAKYLHETAKVITTEFEGDVLQSMDDYHRLPGIGEYTAKAIKIFSNNEDIVTIDTNIRRIYIHEFGLDEMISKKSLYEIAEKCLPQGKSRIWHNALMDYGAIKLTSNKTGIQPLTKQSKFKGSDRQIRGQILRLLLHQSRSINEINKRIEIDKLRLKKILEQMVKEQFLSKDEHIYEIKKER